MLVLLTASDSCPHYLHRAQNVRVCRSERGTKYIVFDCGSCGRRDVVDSAEAGQGPADVNEAGDVASVPAFDGGPRQRSVDAASDSSIMETNLASPADGFSANAR